jgi:hypothetical protein
MLDIHVLCFSVCTIDRMVESPSPVNLKTMKLIFVAMHTALRIKRGRPGIQKLIMKIIDDNVGKSISIASIWTYPKLVFLNYLCLNLFTIVKLLTSSVNTVFTLSCISQIGRRNEPFVNITILGFMNGQ